MPQGEGPRVIEDRFEVIRVLGQGSSGRTLLCREKSGTSPVAVKELHFEHLDDWKQLELFEREADVLSRLDHPGIPKILDFFRAGSESTTLCIVQEFVEGTSLQLRMDSGPMLGQEEVHEVALGLLEILEYLHGRSPPVLHRDIKPSNVLIRPEGKVALVDFGGVCSGWRLASQAGATVVGTFGYMPPEQMVGQAGPTSDLYALGATLLHVVTGKLPTDFPFDSGRIEVPRDLPCDGPLARLIEALLRPAARDRPQTAVAARQFLTDPPQEPAGVIVRADDASPSPVPRQRVVIASDDGPRLVDLGPPPRDPEGEFKGVYRNLVNPLFPDRRLWSGGIHGLWICIAGLGTVMSLGTLQLVLRSIVRKRKRRYDDLFREGESARGVILSVERGSTFATFKYEFEVDGTVYIAFMDNAVEMARFWGEGDSVPVLYDQKDPRRSCFVYG